MATPAAASPAASQPNLLGSAGRLVDGHIQSDSSQLELSAQLKIATHSKTGSSVCGLAAAYVGHWQSRRRSMRSS